VDGGVKTVHGLIPRIDKTLAPTEMRRLFCNDLYSRIRAVEMYLENEKDLNAEPIRFAGRIVSICTDRVTGNMWVTFHLSFA
jgi:hypothetical protein